MSLINYVSVLRVKQWLKNFLLFFPAFFSLSIFQHGVLFQLLLLTIGFSFIASSVYIFNDLSDVVGDALHPQKKNKPITAGKIGKKQALIYAVILFALGLTLSTFIYFSSIYFLLLYVFINVVYSLWAKHIPILDIVLVSTGFLIRIYLGAWAVGVAVSWWLSSLIFLMAIYILIAKRKDDVLCFQQHQIAPRKHIHFYNKVNFSIVLYGLSILIILLYSFYTFSDVTTHLFKSDYLWLTIPLAALGIFSFTHSVIKTNSHFEPISLILNHKVILLTLILWMSLFGWLIYG